MSAAGTKVRCGAYLTDGTGLYEVTCVRVIGPGVKVVIEDCRTFAARELDMTHLRRFRLVRAPDLQGGA
jgi:hypothetical protein